jgi:hypothetical protein
VLAVPEERAAHVEEEKERIRHADKYLARFAGRRVQETAFSKVSDGGKIGRRSRHTIRRMNSQYQQEMEKRDLAIVPAQKSDVQSPPWDTRHHGRAAEGATDLPKAHTVARAVTVME